MILVKHSFIISKGGAVVVEATGVAEGAGVVGVAEDAVVVEAS